MNTHFHLDIIARLDAAQLEKIPTVGCQGGLIGDDLSIMGWPTQLMQVLRFWATRYRALLSLGSAMPRSKTVDQRARTMFRCQRSVGQVLHGFRSVMAQLSCGWPICSCAKSARGSAILSVRHFLTRHVRGSPIRRGSSQTRSAC